jgi:hypothetical protein
MAHFDEGRGVLCKDPVFMTELMYAMHTRHTTRNAVNASQIEQCGRAVQFLQDGQGGGQGFLLEALNDVRNCYNTPKELATSMTGMVTRAFERARGSQMHG